MKARPSMEKRRKELARQDRKQAKLERREQRKAERAAKGDAAPGEDPDIAHIVAGPQPTPEWMKDSADEAPEADEEDA